MTALAVSPAAASAADVHVETTGTDSPTCGALATPCLTIAQATTNAVNGDTVRIGDGTFVITNVINPGNKSVEFVGNGPANTTVSGNDSTSFTQNGMFRFQYNGTTGAVKDLSITHMGKTSGGSSRFGIWVQPSLPSPALPSYSADVVVDNVSIVGNTGVAASENGIYAASNAGSFSLTNSTLTDVMGNSILLEQQTGPATITDNTINRTGSSTGSVIFNMTHANAANNQTYDVTGALDISRNTINASSGITVLAGWPYTSGFGPSAFLGGVTIGDNSINTGSGAGPGVALINATNANDGTPGRILNAEISGNSIFGAGTARGINLQGGIPDAQITDNNIRGRTDGILLNRHTRTAAPNPGTFDHYPTGTQINGNQIVDNTTGVTTDPGIAAIDTNLDGNWWGCNEGPDVAASPTAGDCDTVSTPDPGSVTLDNWIVLGLGATPPSALPTAGSAALTAGFTKLNTGAPAPAAFDDGTLLSMTATGGTLATANPSLTSGVTTNTFTSTAPAGRSAGVTFDHETVTNNWADDTTPPVVTISAPTANAFLNTSPATVTYTVTDFGGGVTCNIASGASVPLTPGANSIVVSCTDAAGNVGIGSVAVTYDPDDPVVTVLAPPDSSTTNGVSTDLYFSVTDATATSCDKTNGAAQPLVEGPNVITVTCTDAAGNSGSDSVTITRDSIPPSVLITSPTDQETTLDANATLTYSVIDATATSCTPNNGSSIPLNYGANTITVSCTDAAGNVGTDSVTVTRTSNVPPVVTITSPSTGAVVSGTSTVLTYNAASQHGTVSCTPPSGSTMPLAIGVNTLTVNCTDNFGNTASASVTVYRPDTLPQCARNVMITDVKRVGSRTRIRGIARLQYAGKRVGIEYQPTGSKKVGNPKIAPDGTFNVVVSRPSSPRYTSNQARYRAVLGSSKTSWIKLTRRMGASAVTYNDNGTLTVTGSVSLPIAKGQPVRVERSDACGKYRQIGWVRMDKDGTFAGNVPTGGGSPTAVNIRLKARVAKSSNPRYRFNTYSIVQPVIVAR